MDQKFKKALLLRDKCVGPAGQPSKLMLMLAATGYSIYVVHSRWQMNPDVDLEWFKYVKRVFTINAIQGHDPHARSLGIAVLNFLNVPHPGDIPYWQDIFMLARKEGFFTGSPEELKELGAEDLSAIAPIAEKVIH